MDRKRQYFASMSAKDCTEALLDKQRKYRDYLEFSGRRQTIETSLRQYYKPFLARGRVEQTGALGEFKDISVNHLRNLVQHSMTAITGTRLIFEPKAANLDVKSIYQTRLAKTILEYYARTTQLENMLTHAVEMAQITGDAFIHGFWDFTKGERVGMGPLGQPLYEGDVSFDLKSTFDVYFEANGSPERDWIVVTDRVNKWDLAALYPEMGEEILNLAPPAIDFKELRMMLGVRNNFYADDDEKVLVHTFYHKATPAVPDGRVLRFCSVDCVLMDSPLPLDFVPVFQLSPSRLFGDSHGYSDVFDLLPLQQAYDKLQSTILTNQAAYGVQSIAMPRGAAFNPEALADGLIVLEYDPQAGKPEALNLTKSAPETFNYLGMLENNMQLLKGVSSTVRGQPDANLRSASAIALVQSITVQYLQSLELAYTKLVEQIGYAIIKFLSTFPVSRRTAMIVGAQDAGQLVAFEPSDLQGIVRVFVDRGNPLMRTISGRLSIAEMQLQYGILKDPMQINEILEHGKLDVSTKEDLSQRGLMQGENEMLLQGQPILAIITDNHAEHKKEHAVLLDLPEYRVPGHPVFEAVMNHIAQHEQLEIQLAMQMGMTSQEAAMGAQMMAGGGAAPQEPVPQGAGSEMTDQPLAVVEEGK